MSVGMMGGMAEKQLSQNIIIYKAKIVVGSVVGCFAYLEPHPTQSLSENILIRASLNNEQMHTTKTTCPICARMLCWPEMALWAEISHASSANHQPGRTGRAHWLALC